MFATDGADRIVLWNKGCEALLGKTARSVLGKRCDEGVGGRRRRPSRSRLGIARVTVRNHVQSILQELNVHSKLEAVVLANRLQLA